MSLRTHAVVVQPDQWSGAPAELARVLAPIVGLEMAPLTDALERGPMTVEADLSAAEARALVSRLSSMGVPAEIHPPAPKLKLPEAGVVPGAIEVDRARITDEVPRTRSSTMVGFKPMVTDEADDGGWGAVFPDLAPKPANSTPGSVPRSLDDLEEVPTVREKSSTAPMAHPAAIQQTTEATPPLRPNALPPSLPIESRAKPATAPVASPPSEPPAAKQPIKPSGFDASKLSALMPEEEPDRPPHKPTGYDPRPEHHPPFAVMFAVLAPGAGEVFNGHDDDGLAVAMRFWAVLPWIRSVHRARADAEKIRTFWSPRPPDGSGIRAFKFVFSFWLCVGLVSVALAWGIPTIASLANREPVQTGPTSEQIGSVFDSATTRVLNARVQALGALERASADLIPEVKYTMSEAERAERLFAIGYFECRRRSFAMCEAMMKRVLQLKPAYGPAIRLQAWGSVSRNGSTETFPDVGHVPTLSELELNKMREEMILEGEQVPPPPKADPDGIADYPDTTPDAGQNPDQGSPR